MKITNNFSLSLPQSVSCFSEQKPLYIYTNFSIICIYAVFVKTKRQIRLKTTDTQPPHNIRKWYKVKWQIRISFTLNKKPKWIFQNIMGTKIQFCCYISILLSMWLSNKITYGHVYVRTYVRRHTCTHAQSLTRI